MAVTSLWHVKGSIKDLIDYIENPEKTMPNQDMQDFFDVFSYVKNQDERKCDESKHPQILCISNVPGSTGKPEYLLL